MIAGKEPALVQSLSKRVPRWAFLQPSLRIELASYREETMSDETIDLLCKHCGQAFSAFLHHMEEHNAKVVCPSCGKPHEHDRPAKAAKTPASKH